MSLSINNNSSSLVALQALNAAQTELSKTENTVSTGKKVDNAADSPAIYSIAAQMNGNLQGMTAVSDSLSLGAQVVATANTAGNKIMASLQTLQNTVTTAGQTGTDASAMATQILSTLDSINSYARNATFSGVNLLTSGNDAVSAYNGTTLQTLTNVQGQTQAFTTMAGSNKTLVDALGLTSNSAAKSTAANSTQTIFSSLNSSNVTHVDTSALDASEIVLKNSVDGSGGTTIEADNKTFEFVQTGVQASTGNIAVALDSGFSTKNALTALVSAMNGAGVNASLNSDSSLAVAGKSGDFKIQSYLYTSAAVGTAGTAPTTADHVSVTVGSTSYTLGSTEDASSNQYTSMADLAKAAGLSWNSTKNVLTSGSAFTVQAGATPATVQVTAPYTSATIGTVGTAPTTADHVSVTVGSGGSAVTYTIGDVNNAAAHQYTSMNDLAKAAGLSWDSTKNVLTSGSAFTVQAAGAAVTTPYTSATIGTAGIAPTTDDHVSVTVGSTSYTLGSTEDASSNQYTSMADLATAAGLSWNSTKNVLTSSSAFTVQAGATPATVQVTEPYTSATIGTAGTAPTTADHVSVTVGSGGSAVTYTIGDVNNAAAHQYTSMNDLATAAGLSWDSTKNVLTSGSAFTVQVGATPATVQVTPMTPLDLSSSVTVSGGTAADQIAVGIKGGVTTGVSAIQSAITNMSSVMQNLGNYSNTLSGLSTYTSSLKDAVTNGVSALTDADMAAESAKLTSLQTKQSLAIKSLTIANGQSQNILSLFQG